MNGFFRLFIDDFESIQQFFLVRAVGPVLQTDKSCLLALLLILGRAYLRMVRLSCLLGTHVQVLYPLEFLRGLPRRPRDGGFKPLTLPGLLRVYRFQKAL